MAAPEYAAVRRPGRGPPLLSRPTRPAASLRRVYAQLRLLHPRALPALRCAAREIALSAGAFAGGTAAAVRCGAQRGSDPCESKHAVPIAHACTACPAQRALWARLP
eukprot:365366-Chlamydomonas_euryale.AAC.9